MVILPVRHLRAVLKSETIILTLTVTVVIASFKRIGKCAVENGLDQGCWAQKLQK